MYICFKQKILVVVCPNNDATTNITHDSYGFAILNIWAKVRLVKGDGQGWGIAPGPVSDSEGPPAEWKPFSLVFIHLFQE